MYVQARPEARYASASPARVRPLNLNGVQSGFPTLLVQEQQGGSVSSHIANTIPNLYDSAGIVNYYSSSSSEEQMAPDGTPPGSPPMKEVAPASITGQLPMRNGTSAEVNQNFPRSPAFDASGLQERTRGRSPPVLNKVDGIGMGIDAKFRYNSRGRDIMISGGVAAPPTSSMSSGSLKTISTGTPGAAGRTPGGETTSTNYNTPPVGGGVVPKSGRSAARAVSQGARMPLVKKSPVFVVQGFHQHHAAMNAEQSIARLRSVSQDARQGLIRFLSPLRGAPESQILQKKNHYDNSTVAGGGVRVGGGGGRATLGDVTSGRVPVAGSAEDGSASGRTIATNGYAQKRLDADPERTASAPEEVHNTTQEQNRASPHESKMNETTTSYVVPAEHENVTNPNAPGPAFATSTGSYNMGTNLLGRFASPMLLRGPQLAPNMFALPPASRSLTPLPRRSGAGGEKINAAQDQEQLPVESTDTSVLDHGQDFPVLNLSGTLTGTVLPPDIEPPARPPVPTNRIMQAVSDGHLARPPMNGRAVKAKASRGNFAEGHQAGVVAPTASAVSPKSASGAAAAARALTPVPAPVVQSATSTDTLRADVARMRTSLEEELRQRTEAETRVQSLEEDLERRGEQLQQMQEIIDRKQKEHEELADRANAKVLEQKQRHKELLQKQKEELEQHFFREMENAEAERAAMQLGAGAGGAAEYSEFNERKRLEEHEQQCAKLSADIEHANERLAQSEQMVLRTEERFQKKLGESEGRLQEAVVAMELANKMYQEQRNACETANRELAEVKRQSVELRESEGKLRAEMRRERENYYALRESMNELRRNQAAQGDSDETLNRNKKPPPVETTDAATGPTPREDGRGPALVPDGDELETRHRELLTKSAHLDAQSAHLDARHSALEERHAHLTKSEDNLTAVVTKVTDERFKKERQRLLGEIKHLEKIDKVAEAEIKRSREREGELGKKHKKALEQLELLREERGNRREAVRMMQREMEQIKNELRTETSQRKQSELNWHASAQEADTLRKRLGELEAELARAKRETLQQAEEISLCKTALERNEKEMHQLANSSNTREDEAARLKAEMRQREQDLEALLLEYAQQTKEAERRAKKAEEDAAAQAEKADGEIAALQRGIGELQERKQEIEGQVAELLKDLLQKDKELEQARGDVTELEKARGRDREQHKAALAGSYSYQEELERQLRDQLEQIKLLKTSKNYVNEQLTQSQLELREAQFKVQEVNWRARPSGGGSGPLARTDERVESHLRELMDELERRAAVILELRKQLHASSGPDVELGLSGSNGGALFGGGAGGAAESSTTAEGASSSTTVGGAANDYAQRCEILERANNELLHQMQQLRDVLQFERSQADSRTREMSSLRDRLLRAETVVE